MAAYYNEFDPVAAQWLRNLIFAGLIPDGDVDSRSITEVTPNDISGYTQCHFFAGLGIWPLALRLAGWGDDKHVWTGSCPCQPFSSGGKGEGFADERHLWPYFHYLIQQRRPTVVFGEQVASKAGLVWFDLVQADLESEGYAATAFDLCAAGAGAPHIRQRLFWVGDTCHAGAQGVRGCEQIIHPERREDAVGHSLSAALDSPVWSAWESDKGADSRLRMLPRNFVADANGHTGRVGRLRAYGNAIVPQVAVKFIQSYMSCTGV